MPRELLRKWCLHLAAADFAERLGDDPGQIPLLVDFNETRTTLT